MSHLPGGTVTLLFTDIEGSTSLWERDRSGMRETLFKRHNLPLREILDLKKLRRLHRVAIKCADLDTYREALLS